MQKAMKGCPAQVQPSTILAREVGRPLPLQIDVMAEDREDFRPGEVPSVRNVFACIVMRLTNFFLAEASVQTFCMSADSWMCS